MKFLIVATLISIWCTSVSTAQQSSNHQNTPAQAQAFVPPPSAYGHENLKSLAVADSSLIPAQPAPGEVDKFPEFTRELLQVQWRDADPIDLYVIRPAGIAKPPVIIYLYSYPSETDRFRDNEYCKRITANGYAAVGFVSALTGHRYHDRPMREWFVSEMPEALAKSVHDVQMTLRFLGGRGDLDVSRLGMFGSGSGATIAILAAAVDPQIRAVEAMQPWGDWPAWLAKSSLVPENERANYLKPEFLDSVAPFDPIKWFGRVQTKAFRVQFVLDDPVTPAPAVQHMKVAASSTAQVLEYPTRRQQYALLSGGRAFDWIKDQLRPPDVHAATARTDKDEQKSHNERTQ